MLGRQNTELNNSFNIKLDRKKTTSHNFCKIFWVF